MLISYHHNLSKTHHKTLKKPIPITTSMCFDGYGCYDFRQLGNRRQSKGQRYVLVQDQMSLMLRFSHFFTYMPLHHAFLTPSSCLPLPFLIVYSMHFPYTAAAAPTAQHTFYMLLPYTILHSTMTLPHYLLVYKLIL